MKPRLLDLFSGAGGAAMGYHRAGFEVVGVDHKPQPHYPFEFIHADAMEFIDSLLRGPNYTFYQQTQNGVVCWKLEYFNAIHASPPCQGYSEATPMSHRSKTPRLIPMVRDLLQAVSIPYIIENVGGARHDLVLPVMLCGTQFDLPIYRHRYFEIKPQIFTLLPPCQHRREPITVHIGSHTRKTWIPVICSNGGDGRNNGGRPNPRPRERVDVVRWAMGIDWMVGKELTEAIPPAYTEFIGKQLLKTLET